MLDDTMPASIVQQGCDAPELHPFGRFLGAFNGALNFFPAVGVNLACIYLISYHAIPYVLYEHLGVPMGADYNPRPIGMYGVVFLALAIAAVILAGRLGWVEYLAARRWPTQVEAVLSGAWTAYCRLRIIPAALLLATGVAFAVQGLSQYRYSGVPVSSMSSPVIYALLVLKPWALADLLAQFMMQDGSSRGRWWRLSSLAATIGWVLAIDGIASAITAAAFVGMAAAPMQFSKWILNNPFQGAGKPLPQRLLGAAVASAAFALLVLVAWNVGDRIKYYGTIMPPVVAGQPSPPSSHGADGLQGGELGPSPYAIPSLGAGFNSRLRKAILWLPVRISVYYYSFADITNRAASGDYDVAVAWHTIGDNLAYRARSLVGGSELDARPKIRTVAQINYYNINTPDSANDRSGTSPGALGSFTFIVPQPFDIVAAIAYLILVSTLLTRAAGGQPARLSLIGVFLVLMLARSLFLDPADYFLVIDGGFVFFLSFVLIVEARYASKARNQELARAASGTA